MVTAAMARDVVLCERRVELDHVVQPGLPIDPTRQLLWTRGLADVDLVRGQLHGTVVDLRAVPSADRARATMAQMVGRPDHVLGGRIVGVGGDLMADVDVLSREAGRWTAALVRAEPFVEDDGRSVPRAFGVELAVAARILRDTGLGAGDRATLLGVGDARRTLDLSEEDAGWDVAGKATLAIARARALAEGDVATAGEAHPRCRTCPHAARCAVELERADDLTLVAGIDREFRGAVAWVARDRSGLAALDLTRADDAGLPGGLDLAGLARLRDRAALQIAGGPAWARRSLDIPARGRELHVSVEVDAALQVVWAVGLLERDRDDGAESHAFLFADGLDGERRVVDEIAGVLAAFDDGRIYLRSEEQLAALCRLQLAHPDLWQEAAFDALLASGRVVLLETVVIEPLVEWPGRHAGVLDVARAEGVALRDDDLSGATLVRLAAAYSAAPSSGTRDAMRKYDLLLCRASAVTLDALAALPVGPSFGRGDAAPNDGEDGPSPEDDASECAEEAALDRALGEDGDEDDGVDWRVRVATGAADETDGDGDGDEGATRPAAGPSRRRLQPPPPRPRAAPVVYATPTLRVCSVDAGRLRREDEGSDYRTLADELPLEGARAYRPTPADGFELAERLRARAPWMEPATAALERSLRVGWWAGRCWLSFRPLLLVGDPGAGKSAFAREVGRVAGVPVSAIELAATSDALGVGGVARGWLSATPCWPARAIAEHRVANPLLVGDELDKAGGSRGSGGVVHDALLGMLEPTSARAYHDRCLLAALDLSAVCWIFTANTTVGIPGALLSRLEVVEVPAPWAEHFDVVYANVFADVVAAWGLPPDAVEDLPRGVVDGLRSVFDRRRSARWLRAAMEGILARVLPHRPRVLH